MSAAVPLSLLRHTRALPVCPRPPFRPNERLPAVFSGRHSRASASTTSSHILRSARLPTLVSSSSSVGASSVGFKRHIASSVDEEAAARASAITADGGPTIFDKIIAKEISSSVVYEDDKALAFRDISPQAPVHVLVIPKLRDGLTQLGKAEPRHEEILGHLLYVAKLVAEKEGILDGFRVVINNGAEACQSVYHLHLHVLGGRQMKWPPG